jgi:Tol biopolymer transport system component
MKRLRLLGVGMGAALLLTAAAAYCQQPAFPSKLHVMNADGSGLKQIITLDDYDAQGSPTWTADGAMLAFDAWRHSAGETSGAAHIFVADADGSKPRDLGEGAMPSFSPDGKRICFTRYEPRGVYLMNADGSERQFVDAEGWSGHFSPDGTRLMYGVGGNIAVYDLGTKSRRMVLTGEQAGRYRYVYWNLCWSPDGKRIAFKGQCPDESYELAYASAESSDKGFQVLYKGQTDSDLAWHPEGKQLVFSMRDPMRKYPQLFWINPDDVKAPRLLIGQPMDRANLNCAWSPDGKQLAFSSRELPPPPGQGR